MSRIQDLIDDFDFFDSWEEKYEFIIDIGKELPDMDNSLKTDETKVQGCMSQVWLVPHYNTDGTISFSADSDAIIVKGLIGLLMRLFNNSTAQKIIDTDIDNLFIKLGLDSNLAGSRRNGLSAMVDKIKHYASIQNN